MVVRTCAYIMLFNIGLVFGIYKHFQDKPEYWEKRNHRCLVTHKTYEQPYVQPGGKHDRFYDAKYIMILRDEKNRSFDLSVTIPTYFNHEVGEYLNFNLSEDDIKVDQDMRDSERYGEMLHTLNGIIFVVALFILICSL